MWVVSDEDGIIYPNRLSGPDSTNTVEKVAIYSPTPGDVLTVYVKGTSIATTASQRYALAVSGTFSSGAWYCQSPLATRTSTDYTTDNCQLSCGSLSKNPICCPSTAGAVCSTAEAAKATSLTCETSAKPYDCVSPSPAPTRTPTQAPSRSPTRAPSRRPTAPTVAPTIRPTRMPSAVSHSIHVLASQ